MSDSHFDRAPAELGHFRHLGAPVEDPEGAAETRRQAIQAIERTVRVASRSTARFRARIFAIAAAALTLVTLVVVQWSRSGIISARPAALRSHADSAEVSGVTGAVTLLRQGRVEAIEGDVRELLAGDELSSTGSASASLKLPRGTRADLGAGTQLRLTKMDTDEQRVTLQVGRLTLTVPRLDTGHSLVVQTPDAEVIVVGTRFAVEVSERAGKTDTTTRVEVFEGAVRVRAGGSERLLKPGEVWSSGTDPARAAPRPAPRGVDPSSPSSTPPEPSHADSASERALRKVASGTPRERAESSTRAESASLAEQNRLMGLALAARQRGDDALAVRHLDELLARHSRSPLAESARVERLRALRRLGRNADAVREARRYLAEYGQGFARDEARDAVLRPERGSNTKASGKR